LKETFRCVNARVGWYNHRAMRRPPERPFPILSSRPAYEWINNVNRKLEQLNSIQLSADSRARAASWLEADFVFSGLSLAGERAERGRVEEIVRTGKAPVSGRADDDASIIRLLEALRVVRSRVESEGRKAELTPGLLLTLDRKPDGAPGEFRKGLTDQMIENACLWFTAGSFEELHPLEQASIVHLRLIEIHPFEGGNEQLALVAASLFTMRSGLPPVIIPQEMSGDYRAALAEGFRMNTKPMVELMARATERALSGMIEFYKACG
jgi:hypothetical protein